jgi:hypothetical protein
MTNTSHHKQETFFYEYPLRWVLWPTKKRITERCSSVVYSSSMVAILTTEPAPEHAHVLPRLSWSWTVLLPSDILVHRKSITSTTAVLTQKQSFRWRHTQLPCQKNCHHHGHLEWQQRTACRNICHWEYLGAREHLRLMWAEVLVWCIDSGLEKVKGKYPVNNSETFVPF